MAKALTPAKLSPALDNSLALHQPGSGKKALPDDDTTIGNGGETHQHIAPDVNHKDGTAHLTDNFGHRVVDNQNSLRAGERGPTLLEDFIFGRKYFISIMSVFRSVSFTHADQARVVYSP